MFATPLTKTLIVVSSLLSLSACNTMQGVKQDAHIAKDKAIEIKDVVVEKAIEVKDMAVQGGKAVGAGLEKAGEAVKGATN